MSAHVTPEELRAAERMPLERRQDVFTHLLQGCPKCRAQMGGLYRWAWNAEPEPPMDGDVYDQAIENAFAKLREEENALARSEDPSERAQIHFLWRALALAALAPLEGLPLCQALLDWSWSLRHDNPQAMIFLAELAVKTAADLDAVHYGLAGVADTQARAWGELANAYRVRDDFAEAERAFDKAFQLLEKGTGDLALKARLFDLQASFFGARRQFMLAFSALDLVHTFHLQRGEVHLAGRALLTKALYSSYAGKNEWALALNREGLSMIDESRDPDLAAHALHNQVHFLIHDGHCREARRFLSGIRPRVLKGGRINELKVRWLEGRISYGLGDLAEAAAAFQEIKDGFEAEEQGFQAALCLLDLSLVRLRQGRTGEAEEAVTQATKVFFSLQVPEVYSAALLLQETLKLEKATVELAEDAVARIRCWQISHPDMPLG